MGKTVMEFSAPELVELALMYQRALRTRKVHPKDPWLSYHVDLLIRLHAAGEKAAGWAGKSIFDIPWVLPVLRKAIADAMKVPDLRRRVQQLEAQLKEARKPKPTPRPARKPVLNKAAQAAIDAGKALEAHRAAVLAGAGGVDKATATP